MFKYLAIVVLALISAAAAKPLVAYSAPLVSAAYTTPYAAAYASPYAAAYASPYAAAYSAPYAAYSAFGSPYTAAYTVY